MQTKKELLAAQDWPRLLPRLTAFAWRRLGRRKDKWEDARDLAQDAILCAHKASGGWDPDEEPLLKYLYLRIKSMASNAQTSARSAFEVSMEVFPEALEVAGEDEDSPEEALDRKRYAEMFRERLASAIANDEVMVAILEQWLDGVDDIDEQAKRTGFERPQIEDARRRVYYRAKEIAKELSQELEDEEDDEVAQ